MISKFIFLLITTLFFINSNASPQQYKWRTLPNSPTAGSRFNDCSFINPNTGWVCNASNGEILKTTNGGELWYVVGSSSHSNRCIAFFDSLNGWAGAYSTGNRFSKTTDGGISWIVVSIPAPSTTGLCGFSIVNDSVLIGCGRYWGPARVVKTTDKGETWTNIDLNEYAYGLVDCYFTSPDSGFVVGRAYINSSNSRALILRTVNGGNDWDTVFHSPSTGQWCWKINFPTKNVGYVSLEPAFSGSHFLKTTDAGISWTEYDFLQTNFDEEGIGFINENTGWIGGWEADTYETTNGGINWHLLDVSGNGTVSNVNRFRFLGDTLGFAVGSRIYKYSKDKITSVESEFKITDFKLYQNYPNPFNPVTKIKIELPEAANISLSIYNILGKEVTTIIEGDYLPAGFHEFYWDATDFPSGVYYYKLYNKDFESTKSMVILK